MLGKGGDGDSGLLTIGRIITRSSFSPGEGLHVKRRPVCASSMSAVENQLDKVAVF